MNKAAEGDHNKYIRLIHIAACKRPLQSPDWAESGQVEIHWEQVHVLKTGSIQVRLQLVDSLWSLYRLVDIVGLHGLTSIVCGLCASG